MLPIMQSAGAVCIDFLPSACVKTASTYAFTFQSACTEGQVLLGGAASSSSKGTIQMCSSIAPGRRKFGTICSLGWDTNDAIVVCNQLGYYGMKV